MKPIDLTQQTIDPAALPPTEVPLVEDVATTSNDNASTGGIEDTTRLAGHREVVDVIRGTLVHHGRYGQALDDDVPEVQARAIRAARCRRMPADLGEWKALCATIAERYAIDENEEQTAREVYDVGLCEEPDACGPLEGASPRDPVDTKRLLETLTKQFEAGDMPEKGAEILAGIADGLSQKEVAAEVGISESAVRHRLARMRKIFAARCAELGLLVLLVMVGTLFIGVGLPIADPHESGGTSETTSAATVVRLVTRREQAATLRRMADEACDRQRWDECLTALGAAADLDPEGDREPGVESLRERALDGLHDRDLRAKPW